MLTGRHPFGETRYAAALDDPGPLEPLPGTAARSGLAAVVDRCLQRAPARRYDSAADLERDLRAIRSGTTLPVAAGGTPARPVGWWQFHLFTATAANSLVILALWHVRAWWPRWRPVAGLPDLGVALLFFAPLALVCLIGVLRFNLAFTVGQHPARTEAQYRRVRPWLRAADAVFAGLVGVAGVLIAADHPNWATLLIACAVSIATVAFVIEPGTAEEAIESVRRRLAAPR
jgi:hypothetical protein